MAKTVSCREGETGAKARRAAVAAPDHPDEVWKRFRRSRSAQSREELIEQYMPLVRAVSARLAAELPNSVDPDDLISAGTFGLMDAIERFDPKLGTRFETYCSVRIRGSILDELRQLNWVPRMQCTRAAKVNMAIAALRGELGRTPTPREIARKAYIDYTTFEVLPEELEVKDKIAERQLRYKAYEAMTNAFPALRKRLEDEFRAAMGFVEPGAAKETT